MTPGDSADTGFEATLRQGLSSIVDAFLEIVGFLGSIGSEPVPTGPDPEEARAARLGEVDIAVGQLATAAAPITDPVLKREAGARQAALALRRKALADAAGDALAGAVADVPGLCSDIAQAVEATTKAAAAQVRVTAHGSAAALALGTAEPLILGLPDTVGDKGVLAGELAGLRTAQADLATAADATTLEANAAKLETDAQALLVRAQAAGALAQLLAEQERQVQAVATADGKLAGALAGLDPLAAEPLKDIVADLRTRAAALATATGEAAIQTQLGLSGALLTGFADAEAAAAKADSDWQALAARRVAAKQKLDDAGALIGGLATGAFPTLDSDHGQLEITFNGLAGAADLATLTNDLAKLEGDAQVLLDAAALAAADTAAAAAEASLDALDLWEADFAKVASPTPLTAQCGQLRTDWGLADAETDQAARKAAFGVIQLAADQAANTSDDVLKRRDAAAGLLTNANSWIAVLPSPAGLDVKHAAAEQAIDDLAAASDLGAYERDLAVVEATAQALYDEATAAAAPGQAAAELAALDVVAAKFSAISTPNPVQTEFDTLTAAHLASASLSGKALTAELLRIETEAFSAAHAWGDLDKRRDDARVSLGNADSWIKALDPVAATALVGRHAAAVKQADDLAAAPDLATFESDLVALETEAQALYGAATTAAAPVQAAANLALLGKVAARFSKIGTPNPVQTAFDTLTAAHVASAALSGQDLTDELIRIQGEAFTAASDWSALETRRDDARAFLENSDGWIKVLGKAAAAPLVARHAAAVKQADDLAGAADIATYESDLAALEAVAAALYTDATSVAAPIQAAAGLAELGPVAAKFTAVATPNPVQTAFDTLTAAHVASASLTGQARTDELVRIQSEAFAAAQKFGAADARAKLKDADSWIKAMDPAAAPLEARYAAAVKAADDLAAAPDLTTFESQLAALDIEAKALLADANAAAAPGVATKSLAYLATLAAKFNKIAKPNAVQTLWDTLTAAHTASGTLADKALTTELTRIQNEAYGASSAWDAKVAIDKRLYALSRPIAALGVTGDPMKLESERIKGQYATCCSSTTDIAGLVAAFKALDAAVDQLATDMRNAQALALDVGKATAEVAAALLAAQAAVGDLAAGDPKKEATTELAALQKRENDAPTLVGADAQKRELFALRAEALAFVEKVRKLGFERSLRPVAARRSMT